MKRRFHYSLTDTQNHNLLLHHHHDELLDIRIVFMGTTTTLQVNQNEKHKNDVEKMSNKKNIVNLSTSQDNWRTTHS